MSIALGSLITAVFALITTVFSRPLTVLWDRLLKYLRWLPDSSSELPRFAGDLLPQKGLVKPWYDEWSSANDSPDYLEPVATASSSGCQLQPIGDVNHGSGEALEYLRTVVGRTYDPPGLDFTGFESGIWSLMLNMEPFPPFIQHKGDRGGSPTNSPRLPVVSVVMSP